MSVTTNTLDIPSPQTRPGAGRPTRAQAEQRHQELLDRALEMFLEKGYEAGFFLFSGPQVPAHGGFLVARAESLEKLQEFLAEEPFVKAQKMRFSRITEFQPAQHQPILKDWFTEAPESAA